MSLARAAAPLCALMRAIRQTHPHRGASAGHLVLRRAASTTDTPPRATLRSLRAAYEAGTPLTMLTAYDYPSARHADLAGVDMVLVGDSVGMVVLGHATTQPVTTADMLYHSRAARRAVRSALLVADMPFGSYELSGAQAARTAIELVKGASVDAVKLEGGRARASAVRAVADAGIAVMGHVGLQPQAVSALGGFRAMGRTAREAEAVLDDALAVQDAGAFAVVVECVPERVAGLVTDALSIPTIGIGSGVRCDGQVLVYHDMLGILSHPHHDKVAPKFSKQYLKLGKQIHDAIATYGKEVRERKFPSERYSPYHISDDEFAEFLKRADTAAEDRRRAGGENSKVRKTGTTQGDVEDISIY